VAHGEPMVWLTGGSLALGLAMIVGLLVFVAGNGLGTFWPREVVRVRTLDGRTLMGQVTEVGTFVPHELSFSRLDDAARAAAEVYVASQDGVSTRKQLRTGNYDLTGTHYEWAHDFELAAPTDLGSEARWAAAEERPEWAIAVERLENGRFYGEPVGFLDGGELVATGPESAWERFREHHGEVRALARERRVLEKRDLGVVNHRIEDARLDLRRVELRHGLGSPEHAAAQVEFERIESEAGQRYAELRERIAEVTERGERYALRFSTAQGVLKDLPLWEIVRAIPANQLGLVDELGVFASRWWEFLSDDPREANSEGGVFPAIFGTVLMTLIMSIAVVPFGVLAALYLREYAKAGVLVSAVRIAINNLAGVPSIVFGVFGLGFFCYIIGASIDELLFEERLPNPTYGTGGLMWASLTLALLTLPVVIVATEEALAAVPSSMREGSYACGATKWQTIQRIVLPRAMPGIMTGMILAVARGAGEVAPLMLVGAVKLSPELPFAWDFPTFGTNRSFMHLGFHIYDLGFQSQNSEAAKPMVFTTTLLLIGIVVVLNVLAITIRTRLRRRYTFGGY
ncbi:MAG TPA: phosphate ABC transporter permease PstA, partial [Planctomycetota bacterium]|nr:phosphate ABC transporter permease PstA [Planctomycetota bacterium]